MMIHLRPIRSDSTPNTMKKGVARTRAIATMTFAACASTFSVWVRKKSA